MVLDDLVKRMPELAWEIQSKELDSYRRGFIAGRREEPRNCDCCAFCQRQRTCQQLTLLTPLAERVN